MHIFPDAHIKRRKKYSHNVVMTSVNSSNSTIFEPLKCSCQVCVKNIDMQSAAMHWEFSDIAQFHAPIFSPSEYPNQQNQQQQQQNRGFHQIFLNLHLKPPRLLVVNSGPTTAIAHINSLNRSTNGTDFCSDIGHTLFIQEQPQQNNTVKYRRYANIPPRRFSNSLKQWIPPIHEAFSISDAELDTTRIWDITDIVAQRDEVRKCIHVVKNTYLNKMPPQVLAIILQNLYDNYAFCLRELTKQV